MTPWSHASAERGGGGAVLPTTTFFNLPEDKRQRVLDAALDEFAEYGYHRASISRIVARAGIPKGSFYQYFSDKHDLYHHILMVAAQRKIAYLDGAAAKGESEGSFFRTIRDMVAAGMQLARDDPRLSTLADGLLRNPDLRQEMLGELESVGTRILEDLLRRGMESGEVDPSLDAHLVAQLVMALSYVMSDHVRERKERLSDEELASLYMRMLGILEHGIRRRD